MRKYCAWCTIKHLSTASSLEEYAVYHDDKRTFEILGNLLEAAAEIEEHSRPLALYIRTLAMLRWIKGNAVPYEELLDMVERLSSDESYEPHIPDEYQTGPLPGEVTRDVEYMLIANLAQAFVLSEEVWGGYLHYWMFVVGHLNLASSFAAKLGKNELSAIIREHRLQYTDDHSYNVPYYELAVCLKLRQVSATAKVGLDMDKDGKVTLSGDTRPYFNDK